MARPIDTNLDWSNVNTDSLPTGLAALYDDLKTAQRLAAQARDAFESAFTEMASVPPSQSLRFGYRFGKLAIAIANEAPITRKPAKAGLDFASLMASR